MNFLIFSTAMIRLLIRSLDKLLSFLAELERSRPSMTWPSKTLQALLSNTEKSLSKLGSMPVVWTMKNNMQSCYICSLTFPFVVGCNSLIYRMCVNDLSHKSIDASLQ